MLARSIDALQLGPASAVLDLCTGSGVLAIQAARRGAGRVVAVDVSRRAVIAAALNARLNGVRVDARRGDLFAPVGGERFDLIVSNPPYLPGPVTELPRRGASRAWEGGPRGRAFVDRICAGAPAHLRPGGSLLVVHSSVCSEAETLTQLRAHGLQSDIVARFPGPLGPILRSRAGWLRRQGVLGDEEREDIVIVRGRMAHAPRPARAAAHLQRQSSQ
jgi:release factor glutamine methyltransferase